MPLKVDCNWIKEFEGQSCALAWKWTFRGQSFVQAEARYCCFHKKEVIAALNSTFPL